jgi:hypothetical protein
MEPAMIETARTSAMDAAFARARAERAAAFRRSFGWFFGGAEAPTPMPRGTHRP